MTPYENINGGSPGWGRVAILNGYNYAQFRRTCRAALMGAHAWEIAIGTKLRPQLPNRPGGCNVRQEALDRWAIDVQRAEDAQKDWDERAELAIMILNNSINHRLQEVIEAMVQAKNVSGIWTELANHNRANDPIYQDDLVRAFNRELWNPKSETLSAFINRLDTYRAKLSGTASAITEDRLKNRLLHALPEGQYWQYARLFCLSTNRDFESSVAYLLLQQ
ncbi:hypothetical protein F5884DRAFT_757082 [Xylogone sp. PMI_703]|nr:hypothetical protein F5884DRAFT_757082 [Xylogone sp. PMI_703]